MALYLAQLTLGALHQLHVQLRELGKVVQVVLLEGRKLLFQIQDLFPQPAGFIGEERGRFLCLRGSLSDTLVQKQCHQFIRDPLGQYGRLTGIGELKGDGR